MPLRDHFHPPLSESRTWQEFHGQWPGMIVLKLNQVLPKGYAAGPRVQVGRYFEVDVGAYPEKRRASGTPRNGLSSGVHGAQSAVLAPPKPTWRGRTGLSEEHVYEVRVHDERMGRTLVAAIEIVSPGNKDRPEAREAFISKCVSLLAQGVCVSVIDLVTERSANLYAEILKRIRCDDPAFKAKAPPLYAVTSRVRAGLSKNADREVESWSHTLKLGKPLPSLPIWLNEDRFVTLDLEASYEETCKALRME